MVLVADDYNQFGHVKDGDFLEPIKKLSFWFDDNSLYKVFSWIPDFCPYVLKVRVRTKQQEEKLPSIVNHIHSLTTIVIRDYCKEVINWAKSISPQFYDDRKSSAQKIDSRRKKKIMMI
ncbi:23156_t:CDS:2, partial [Gigaspora rosea]